jgi:UDPglucose 6-dehydrogenase/GDP-mannose 6-dehydrogenase
VKALVAHGEEVGRPMHLLHAVLHVNAEQPHQILSLLHKHFPSLSGVRVAVLGLAFKPGTDDMREAPAIPIIHDLLAEGASIQAYDPVAIPEARNLLCDPSLRFCNTLQQSIDGVQAVILVTSWEEFRGLPDCLAYMEPQPLVVDCRRMLPKHSVARYTGIGL